MIVGTYDLMLVRTTHDHEIGPDLTPLEGAGRHDKSELGAAVGGGLHGDGAVVRLDQSLDDVQAAPGAATALAPPELAEDSWCHLGRDALTLVADEHGDARLVVYQGRLDHSCHATSAVPERILNKVDQDLVDLVSVQPGFRQLTGHLEPEPVLGLAAGDPAGDDLAYPLRDVDQLAVHFHPPGLDPGYVEQLGDQPGDPVRVGVDRLQHDALLVVGEPAPLVEQRGREALDAGQRRAQLVRDGRHELGAVAFQPLPLFRAAHADDQPAHGT